MYEVELGKNAQTKGVTQDIKDQGNTEAHDHTLVGDKLKSIIEANGMEFPKQLNAEFQARLDKNQHAARERVRRRLYRGHEEDPRGGWSCLSQGSGFRYQSRFEGVRSGNLPYSPAPSW